MGASSSNSSIPFSSLGKITTHVNFNQQLTAKCGRQISVPLGTESRDMVFVIRQTDMNCALHRFCNYSLYLKKGSKCLTYLFENECDFRQIEYQTKSKRPDKVFYVICAESEDQIQKILSDFKDTNASLDAFDKFANENQNVFSFMRIKCIFDPPLTLDVIKKSHDHLAYKNNQHICVVNIDTNQDIPVSFSQEEYLDRVVKAAQSILQAIKQSRIVYQINADKSYDIVVKAQTAINMERFSKNLPIN